jgi:hypothetical protein
MYRVPPVKCIDTFAVAYIAAGFNIFQDIIILLIPVPILLSLNIAWKKNLSVLVMFSLGSFVIICSALSLPSLKKLRESADPSCECSQTVYI